MRLFNDDTFCEVSSIIDNVVECHNGPVLYFDNLVFGVVAWDESTILWTDIHWDLRFSFSCAGEM